MQNSKLTTGSACCLRRLPEPHLVRRVPGPVRSDPAQALPAQAPRLDPGRRAASRLSVPGRARQAVLRPSGPEQARQAASWYRSAVSSGLLYPSAASAPG